MRTITVSRKPISEGNVASNVLKHGTGALNIDASRVAVVDEAITTPQSNPGKRQGAAGLTGFHDSDKDQFQAAQRASAVRTQEMGRWPPNLILQHQHGCAVVGSGEIERPERRNQVGHKGQFKTDIYGDAQGRTEASLTTWPLEVFPVWACGPNCPVPDLPTGSTTGERTDNRRVQDESGVTKFTRGVDAPEYTDAGSVARYYKQFTSDQSWEMGMTQDLLDYLITLISPPDASAIYIENSCSVFDNGEIAKWENNSIPGLIVGGTPTEEESKEFLRVLRPGAHLLLIAPDEEKTGHTGACMIEDAGFEIRDTILLVQEPGKLHYVPKAARTEREVGKGVYLGEGNIHNLHPTVKPVQLMARLMHDVPKDEGPVVDPFLGSGSTGMACLETGHDFIGIEREEQYLGISDARIRQHDTIPRPHGNAEIISDFKPPEITDEQQAAMTEDAFPWEFGDE